MQSRPDGNVFIAGGKLASGSRPGGKFASGYKEVFRNSLGYNATMDDRELNARAIFAGRIDPAWTAQYILRVLTDEPGKGMGAPFSTAQAQLFLRACGLAQPALTDGAADSESLERMLRYLVAST